MALLPALRSRCLCFRSSASQVSLDEPTTSSQSLNRDRPAELRCHGTVSVEQSPSRLLHGDRRWHCTLPSDSSRPISSTSDVSTNRTNIHHRLALLWQRRLIIIFFATSAAKLIVSIICTQLNLGHLAQCSWEPVVISLNCLLLSVNSTNETLLFDRFLIMYDLCVFTCIIFIFTALHVMQTRYCDEISVRPSVCPSVCPSHAWIVTKR